MWRFGSTAAGRQSGWDEPEAGHFRADTTRYNRSLHVAPGEVWELDGVTVYGNVTVAAGGVLRMTDSQVHGNLSAAPTSLAVVRDSLITGPVLICPDPQAPPRIDSVSGGVALMRTRIQADVRCVGQVDHPASLILGQGTIVTGSVITAHTDVVDQGASVRLCRWDTEQPQAPISGVIDLSGVDFNAHGIVSGMAS